MTVSSVEFYGVVPAEAFRAAADWLAANDGRIGPILAVDWTHVPGLVDSANLTIVYDRP